MSTGVLTLRGLDHDLEIGAELAQTTTDADGRPRMTKVEAVSGEGDGRTIEPALPSGPA